MFVLEYRSQDSNQDFPALFHYTLSKEELIGRLSCGFLIREGKQYKIHSTATESDQLSIAYVSESPNYHNTDEKNYQSIGFEIREWANGLNAFLVESREFSSHLDVLQYLHSDYIYVKSGDVYKEMELDSLELDEDRNCYIFYGTYTGVIAKKVNG